MRQGFLPSQHRALKRAFRKADAFDRFRHRTRRAFLGMGLLAVSAGLGGFLAGRRISGTGSRQPDPSPDAEGAGLDAIALGPLMRLQANYPAVLARLETGRATAALWFGYERLLLLALSSTPGVRTSLGRDLLLTANHVEPPTDFRDLVRALEQRVKR